MNDIMIDLETLGTTADSGILSISVDGKHVWTKIGPTKT